jgi:hypothetical protein
MLSSVLNKSAKKALEPDEQITVKSHVAIVKDLVTKNLEDGHIIFCEDASNIVSHPRRPLLPSAPADASSGVRRCSSRRRLVLPSAPADAAVVTIGIAAISRRRYCQRPPWHGAIAASGRRPC